MVGAPSTTTPGVTVGKPIEIASIAARTQVDVAIPVKLSTSASVNSTMDLSVRVDSNAGCNTRTLLVGLHAPIGVDEKAAIATTDHVETRLVAWTPTSDLDGAGWSRATDPTGNHVLLGTEAAAVSNTQAGCRGQRDHEHTVPGVRRRAHEVCCRRERDRGRRRGRPGS